MRQVVGTKLTTLELPALEEVTGSVSVRAHSRPRSADRTLSRAHRAELLELLSWRVATRASGESAIISGCAPALARARLIAPAAARIEPSLPCR